MFNRQRPGISSRSLNSGEEAVHGADSGRYTLVDLHCHSLWSDGSLPIRELIERARAAGLAYFSITDHDTLSGQAEARSEAAGRGLNYVNGVEWSAQWNGYGIHVVGLGFDPDHPLTLEAETQQQAARSERALTIARRLEKTGVAGAEAWVLAQPENATIGRPHFARWMVEAGWVRTADQAFKRYLGAGKVGDVKALWPSVETVVNWVSGAGGAAVLAHPHRYRMTGRKRRLLIEAFAEAGGAALEIGVPGMQVSMRDQLVRLANEFDLAGSSGSDFHNDGQRWLRLGVVPPLPNGIRPIWEVL